MSLSRTTRRRLLHGLVAGVPLSTAAANAVSRGGEASRAAPGGQAAAQAVRPHPAGADADIWVFFGQSNSQGWGLLKEPVPPDPRILFFNANNEWVLAEEPLNQRFYTWTPAPVDRNIRLQRQHLDFPAGPPLDNFLQQRSTRKDVPLGGVGAGVFFAKHLVRYLDRPIGLMHCGVGGSPIKSWDPSQRGNEKSNYGAMLKRIEMVGGRVKGMIWYQGESDGMTPGAEGFYEQKLVELVDAVRRDIGTPDLPILCVQIAQFVWPEDIHGRRFEAIRDIHRRLPELRKNTYTVTALDLPLEDPAHVSFEGFQRLGPRLAEVALSQVYGLPGHATPIGLDSFEVIQPENRRAIVRVRFKGVNGKLRSPGRPMQFELRMSTNRPPLQAGAQLPDTPLHVVYRVDFDPNDPAAVLLGAVDANLLNTGGRKFHSLTEHPFSVVYGPGMYPYINIVDDKDMAVPAFGPVNVPIRS